MTLLPRKSYASLVLLIGCASIGCDNEPLETQSGSFSALTYNVAGLPEGISGSNPETNMSLISPLLNNYDLALLQEDFAYHRELIEFVEHEYKSYPLEDYSSLVGDGLNRLSDFEFPLDVERIKWNSCYGGLDFGSSDCLASKGFSYAKIDVSGDLAIGVYNFHAEAGGGDEDNAARAEGFGQMRDHIAALPADLPILMGGDTNLHGFDEIDEPVLLSFMEDANLEDVCRFLDCQNEQIDRFFFRSSTQIDITPTLWQIAEAFVDEDGEDLSDHKAIHVDFDWAEISQEQ
jgi:hypothetical protein